MSVFPLLAVGFFMKFVAVVFVICAMSLVLVILIQKGRGGGLSGTFGGAGGASGILGSKTGDFLTWFTIVLVGVFLLLAVVMAKFYRPSVSDFGDRPTVRQEQPAGSEQPLVPAATGETDNGTDANSLGD